MIIRNTLRLTGHLLIKTVFRNQVKSTTSALIVKHQINVDVLKNAVPEAFCYVLWEKTRSKAKLGNVLEPRRTKDPPCVQWKSDIEELYTILMINPDMPHRSKPEFRNFLHWMVGNIPGPNLNRGKIFAEYVGPAPPIDTGLHRFIILVYKQPDNNEISEPCITKTQGDARKNFNLHKFIEKHNFGPPVGLQYFFAEFDERAEKLLVQMRLEKLLKRRKKTSD